MKFFKKHKIKNITVGIRECRTCENNIQCRECAYSSENEMLKTEIEESRIAVKSYKGKYESAVETARELKLVIAEKQAEIEDLNKNRNGLLRKCVSAYHEGINCFAERLCDGRVSNDPVVIAVRCELKEMVGEDK